MTVDDIPLALNETQPGPVAKNPLRQQAKGC
jgi:hypothetical protein